MPLNISGSIVNSAIASTLNYKSVVTRGLILQLEAGAPDSYPQSGTSWYDLSTSANNGTLNSSPTFSSSNGSGSFSFNGSTQDVSISSITNAYPFTLSFWASYPYAGWAPASSGFSELLNMSIASQRVSIGTIKNTGWPTGPVIMYGGSNHWSFDSSTALATANQFYNVVYVVYASNDSRHSVYVNGTSYTLTNNGGAHGGTAGWKIASNGSSGEYWPGAIANINVYNRTLSSTEIIQNYNVQKSRFGY
jgi:hypothetical protein